MSFTKKSDRNVHWARRCQYLGSADAVGPDAYVCPRCEFVARNDLQRQRHQQNIGHEGSWTPLRLRDKTRFTCSSDGRIYYDARAFFNHFDRDDCELSNSTSNGLQAGSHHARVCTLLLEGLMEDGRHNYLYKALMDYCQAHQLGENEWKTIIGCMSVDSARALANKLEWGLRNKNDALLARLGFTDLDAVVFEAMEHARMHARTSTPPSRLGYDNHAKDTTTIAECIEFTDDHIFSRDHSLHGTQPEGETFAIALGSRGLVNERDWSRKRTLLDTPSFYGGPPTPTPLLLGISGTERSKVMRYDQPSANTKSAGELLKAGLRRLRSPLLLRELGQELEYGLVPIPLASQDQQSGTVSKAQKVDNACIHCGKINDVRCFAGHIGVHEFPGIERERDVVVLRRRYVTTEANGEQGASRTVTSTVSDVGEMSETTNLDQSPIKRSKSGLDSGDGERSGLHEPLASAVVGAIDGSQSPSSKVRSKDIDEDRQLDILARRFAMGIAQTTSGRTELYDEYTAKVLLLRAVSGDATNAREHPSADGQLDSPSAPLEKTDLVQNLTRAVTGMRVQAQELLQATHLSNIDITSRGRTRYVAFRRRTVAVVDAQEILDISPECQRLRSLPACSTTTTFGAHQRAPFRGAHAGGEEQRHTGQPSTTNSSPAHIQVGISASSFDYSDAGTSRNGPGLKRRRICKNTEVSDKVKWSCIFFVGEPASYIGHIQRYDYIAQLL
ncbi:hypothetical protein Slin15195_G062830 [Septoria linicola]|uniref:Uncharacterized protein n=1 Tax=Septoria linicola TaxID=215465 RepID=A0A9Q9EK74_9PEZI|nr:hypothetical protein Slin15195_G062830 [Septoria linicola]